MNAVWPDTAVTDNSVTRCMLEIRRALAGDSQQLIRTVSRRGYVFTAAVTTSFVQIPRQPAAAQVEPLLLRFRHSPLLGGLRTVSVCEPRSF